MRECLWLCSGHSHKVLDGRLEVIISCIAVVGSLLAGCLLNEGARESSSRQAITPARYDEGILATKHNAAIGEKGCHNNNQENSSSIITAITTVCNGRD